MGCPLVGIWAAAFNGEQYAIQHLELPVSSFRMCVSIGRQGMSDRNKAVLFRFLNAVGEVRLAENSEKYLGHLLEHNTELRKLLQTYVEKPRTLTQLSRHRVRTNLRSQPLGIKDAVSRLKVPWQIQELILLQR